MELQPDYSLFAQVVLFIVLWIGLKRLLFEPVLQVLDARRERTVGTVQQAAEVRAGAEKTREQCQAAIRDVRMEIAREAAESRKMAQEEHARALASARAEAAEEVARFRVALSRQVEEARGTLAAEASAIAEQMLACVTGRAGT